MKRRFVYIFVFVFVINSANGRVYYMDNSCCNPAKESIYPVVDNFEQYSRDLDLSFSAGDLNDGDNIRPTFKKVYAYAVPERQFVDYSKEAERPVAYYRNSEVPARKTGWGEIFFGPERNRKLVKLNNGHKGEVLLELRVTANNDDV